MTGQLTDIIREAELVREALERDVRGQEELRQKVLDCAPVLVVKMDTQTIVYATKVVTKMFGYVNGALIGHSLDTLIPQRFRDIHDQHFAKYASDPTERMMGEAMMHLFGLHKDGSEFPVEIGLYPFKSYTGLWYAIATVVRQRG